MCWNLRYCDIWTILIAWHILQTGSNGHLEKWDMNTFWAEFISNFSKYSIYKTYFYIYGAHIEGYLDSLEAHYIWGGVLFHSPKGFLNRINLTI